MNAADKEQIQSCDRHLSLFIRRIYPSEDDRINSLLECLSYSARNGNICLEISVNDSADFNESRRQFLESCATIPFFVSVSLEKELSKLIVSDVFGEKGPLVYENNKLYIRRYYDYEKYIAKALSEKSVMEWRPGGKTADAEILKSMFPAAEDEDQKQAALLSMDKKLAVITGGPGTGKTTTVMKILALHILENKNLRISLAAPTGKAALRLKQSISDAMKHLENSGILDSEILRRIPAEVQTLHRLLKYNGSHFLMNRENPLSAELVVVDEASMVDINIFYRLLQAMPHDAGLLIIGDHFQLASVEAGSVLGDICNSAYANADSVLKKNIAELKINRRFSQESGIAKLSRDLKNPDPAVRVKSSLNLLKEKSIQDIKYADAESFSTQFSEEVMAGYSGISGSSNPKDALDSLYNFRILSPHRKGIRGVESINQFVANLLLKNNILKRSGSSFHGLPVMVLRNDYTLNLYNGDTGILWDDGSGLRAYFYESDSEEKLRSFIPEMISSFEPCFAMTVHKSQGSEFNSVLFILPEHPSPILTVELFYTALTRARMKFSLAGSDSVIESMISRKIIRASGLGDSLILNAQKIR